jgi:putative membrane protein
MYIIIIFYITISGLIIKFIHPRTIPYTIICGIILGMFLLLDIFNKDKAENKKLFKSDVIYIVPLILVFFLNNGVLSSNQINNKNTNITKAVSEENTEITNGNDVQEITSEKSKENDIVKEETKANTKIETIKITDSNYMEMLMNIFDNINNYADKEIDIDGLVFRDSTMKSDEFAIGRPAITCCAADAQLCGYLCKNSTSIVIKDNDWVNIKATIKTSKYQSESIPYLIVKEIKSISKPKNEYVY